MCRLAQHTQIDIGANEGTISELQHSKDSEEFNRYYYYSLMYYQQVLIVKRFLMV